MINVESLCCKTQIQDLKVRKPKNFAPSVSWWNPVVLDRPKTKEGICSVKNICRLPYNLCFMQGCTKKLAPQSLYPQFSENDSRVWELTSGEDLPGSTTRLLQVLCFRTRINWGSCNLRRVHQNRAEPNHETSLKLLFLFLSSAPKRVLVRFPHHWLVCTEFGIASLTWPNNNVELYTFLYSSRGAPRVLHCHGSRAGEKTCFLLRRASGMDRRAESGSLQGQPSFVCRRL